MLNSVVGIIALAFSIIVPLSIWSDTREIRREVLALRKEVAYLSAQIKQMESPLSAPKSSGRFPTG